MLTVITISLFLCISIYEYTITLKNEGKKTKIIHISLMSVSFCVLLLYSLRINVPSPTRAIEFAINAILKK